MPRTALTVTAGPGAYSSTGAVVTMTAADTGNLNKFVASGKDLIIAQNTDSSSHTVTVTSVADDKGRTGDVSAVTLAAGEIRVFGPMLTPGWLQSDGNIYLQSNSNLVKFGVVSLP